MTVLEMEEYEGLFVVHKISLLKCMSDGYQACEK